ncbi:MAG: DUF5696 domain-containing protein, partial [Clostridiales bacterium]|nr:DUF5696 domain-containing protein [Clostridiales bacterium]
MKKFLSFAAILIYLILISGCTTRVREGGEVLIYGYETTPQSVVSIDNGILQLDFHTDTAEIVLTELGTGNIWRSYPEGIEEISPEEIEALIEALEEEENEDDDEESEDDDIENDDEEDDDEDDEETEEEAAAEAAARESGVERFNAQSLFILTFEDRTGAEVRYDAFRFAIREGRFVHEVVNDTTLELRFTVGVIPETFQIPDAIDKEKLDRILNTLERASQRRVQNVYNTVVSLTNVPRDMSLDDLLIRFPMLEDGREIYLKTERMPSHNYRTAESILQDAGYTEEDWLEDMEYFNISTELNQPAFNLVMRFELEDNNMKVTVPLNEITYVDAFMPTQLTILPYFGAGHPTDDGYLFVPDGSGAIMYFDSDRNTSELYFNRMYGWDEAIVRESVLHDNRAAYPVYGVYRNGTTFAAIIEEGSSYASIRAQVAGMGGSAYSRVHPVFRLLHGAPLDVRGRSNNQLFMHEWELPNENIVIRYTVAKGDGYVGMAHAYRDYLQEKYPWLNERRDEPVYAMVEFLGAALTPQHVLGFPVDRPFPFTSYDGVAENMQVLHDYGWRNLFVQMRGAHNKSIDHVIPQNLELISQLGGRRGFNNMTQTAERLGYDFYLEGDFMFMRGDKSFDGFSPMRDAARQANRERVAHAGYSIVYFGAVGTGAIMADPIILARPEYTINLAENFVNEAASAGVNNMSFRSMASALAGDFNEDRHVTREAAMNMRVDLLSRLRDNGTGIWLNYGFVYGVPYADVITGMPLTDQNFAITDVNVPFYQIALHGLVP